MNRADIKAEIRRRAQHYIPLNHLIVDYYRIRRRLAYPLPIRALHQPALAVSGVPDYPWSIWMAWELQERIECLGLAAEWFNDPSAREAATRDVDALAAWPTYRHMGKPDLTAGHTARILWNAHAHWTWLDGTLRRKIEEAFLRVIADILPLSDALHGTFTQKEDILALEKPHTALHNIPIIGTLGAALAANAIGHSSAEGLNRRLHTMLGALLDLHGNGVSEGVAYDGYVLTFVADWLETLTPGERAPILTHPRLNNFLNESYMLAAPGAATEVAELSDVEPRQMPFHLSAQAKLQHWSPHPQRIWHLQRCDPQRLRADALAALHQLPDEPEGSPAPAGALDAHYALVLRSGWEKSDVAVAIAASNSPMHHIHHDNGSVVIGTAGCWFIADPGYQQYMQKREREFTLGPGAHNAPVINGQPQTQKNSRRVALEERGRSLRAELDLTACYPSEVRVASVLRTVWLSGKHVVIADRVRGTEISSLTYHWHGHVDGAWWIAECYARLVMPDATLWITCPQSGFSEANLDRLPGSRGHLTLKATADVQAPTVWWIFSFGDSPPKVRQEAQSLWVDSDRFEV